MTEEVSSIVTEKENSSLNPELDVGIKKYEGVYVIESMPSEVITACEKIKELGGLGLLVGGSVRDTVISKEHPDYDLRPKDFDIEVYGMEAVDLLNLLETTFGEENVGTQGEAFSVIKVSIDGWDEPLDFSISRVDNKVAEGHRGFKVTGIPNLTISEAAKRRDFTCNSLAYDPLTKITYDAYNGVQDIRDKIIRVTDENTFIEDAVRVLRGFQFAARFDFNIEQSTLELFKEMVRSDEMAHMPVERVREEMEKLMLKCMKPSRAFQYALETGFIEQFWPEIYDMAVFPQSQREYFERCIKFMGLTPDDIKWNGVEVPQENDWHPEGNVWKHTMQVIDAAASIAREQLTLGNMFFSGDQELVEQSYGNHLKEQIKIRTARNQIKLLSEISPERQSEVLAYLEKRKQEMIDETRRIVTERKLKGGKNKLNENVLKNIDTEVRQQSRVSYIAFFVQTAQEYINDALNDGLITKSDIEKLSEISRKEAEKNATKKAEHKKNEVTKDNMLVLMYSALLHDAGKPATTEYDMDKGRIRSIAHEERGVEPARNFLKRIYPQHKEEPDQDKPTEIPKSVIPLVAEHLKPLYYWKNLSEEEMFEKAIRNFKKLAVRLDQGSGRKGYGDCGGANMSQLAWLAEADQRGRNERSGEPSTREEVDDLDEWQAWYFTILETLKISDKAPAKLLSGQDILDYFKSNRSDAGPWIGVLINAVQKDFLDNLVEGREGGLALVRGYKPGFEERMYEDLGENPTPGQVYGWWAAAAKLDDPRILFTTVNSIQP